MCSIIQHATRRVAQHMILEINDEELKMLLKERYLMPNLVTDTITDTNHVSDTVTSASVDTFLINIQSATGATHEICVAHRKATQGSLQLHTDIANNSNIQTTLFVNVDDWLDDWRAAWTGKRLKAIGDRANCLKNMTEFLKIYPMYTKDIVFKARDRYLAEFNGDYSYLEQADYFIKKQVYVEGERQIRRTLLQYCEAVEMTQKVLAQQSLLTTVNPYDDI